MVTLVATALGWSTAHLRPRIARRCGIGVPDGYEDLRRRCASEPTPDDPRPELVADLARLLTYELDSVSGDVPLAVVFLDTFERLRQDPRGEGERLINQIVWSMDNVLFVVTGREPLTWWNATGSVPHRGPAQWPLLVPDADQEPRQHRLDYLPLDDRIELLGLARQELHLDLPDEVVRLMAERSGGLPEYLRLAVEDARVKAANGIPITAERVAGNLESLVQRLFEDVPPDQQAAIRAATLFPAADAGLVAAAAGTSDGAAAAAIARPFFDSANNVPGHRVMHDTIREVIRDTRTPGGWADEDWNAAGTRALELLRRRNDAARDTFVSAVTEGDTAGAAQAVRALLWQTAMAVTVVCEVDAEIERSDIFEAYPDWVAAAVVNGPSIAGLYPFLPTFSRTAYGDEILNFVRAKSPVLEMEEKIALLRRLFSASRRLSWISGRHLGYALRYSGEWGDAATIFDQLLEQRPDNVLAQRQRLITDLMGRRYRTVQRRLQELDGSAFANLLQRIERDHGWLAGWIQVKVEQVARQRKLGRIKDSLESEGACLVYRAFRAQESLDVEIGDFRERVLVAGHRTGQGDARATRRRRTRRPASGRWHARSHDAAQSNLDC
jgi:hypothetical protein